MKLKYFLKIQMYYQNYFLKIVQEINILLLTFKNKKICSNVDLFEKETDGYFSTEFSGTLKN